MTYDIVEGTTDALQFQLLENGSPIDLSPLTVTLLLEDCTGTTVTSPGTLTVIDSTNGRIQLAPTSITTFVASIGPYFARWKLTNNSSGVIGFVPSTNRDVWNIVGV